jgi:hypothetical protein
MTPNEARELAAALAKAAADAEGMGLSEIDLQGALSEHLGESLDSLQAAINAAKGV